MPNYDYKCTECGHTEEILQKMTEQAIKDCPVCHKTTYIRNIGSGLGLHFQGTGFYVTDYK